MSPPDTRAVGGDHPLHPSDPDTVRATLAALPADRLRQLGHEARQLVDDDDVTRDGDPHGRSRWRVDPLPLVLGPDEWDDLAAGLLQRAELLDLVLTDLYGPRDLVGSGLLPPEVVFAHPGFLRPLAGVRRPGPHQLVMSATELLRTPGGDWVPVADRTDVPSGVAYALENRAVVSRLLPDLHRAAGVERLAPYVRGLRSQLRAAAPPDVEQPRIAVLADDGDQAFEHGSLAALLGYPLVAGPDLAVRDGRVWLRSLGSEPVRIDVLLRRVPSPWCDPLELRHDSARGAAGLVEAVRRGGVAVVNGLGAGVLESPGLQAFLPALARALLGQDLRLPGPRTWWCGGPDALAGVLDRLDDLVLRPLAPALGASVDPRMLDAEARRRLRARVQATPHRWVGQQRVPTASERGVDPMGGVTSGRIRLRTFALAHDDGYLLLRGGLAEVAAAGGHEPATWSKDVWVLGGDDASREDFWLHRGPPVAADAPESVVSARTVENMLWLGRYAERAEGTVRLLRAIDARRAERSGSGSALEVVIDRLLVALTDATRTGPGFHDPAQRAAPDDELHSLVVDADREGTLAYAAGRLLDAARAVRDQLSADAWPVLTSLERQLLGDGQATSVLASGARGPAWGRGALAHVLTLLLALHGLAAESLVRDPSWRFLEAGRRLERAQQLVGLLRATLAQVGSTVPGTDTDEGAGADAAATSLLLESVLVACESVITYRRRYRSRAQVATVLELLLRDPDNPRSLRWQADRLLEVLPALEPGAATPVTDAVRQVASALRTADVAALEGEALAGLLQRLDDQLRRAGSELARTVFAPPPSPRPMVAERTGDELLA